MYVCFSYYLRVELLNSFSPLKKISKINSFSGTASDCFAGEAQEGSEVVVIHSVAQVSRIIRGSEFEVDVLEAGAYSGFGKDCVCQVSAAGSWDAGL